MTDSGPSDAVELAAALDAAPTLAAQTVAALRAWPMSGDLMPADSMPEELDDPALIPVGLADRALLVLHEQVLGRPLEHAVACDGCGALTTLPLGSSDVAPHHPRCAWTGPGSGVREPTLDDVMAANGDVAELLRRCGVGAGGDLDDLAGVEGSLSGPLHATCPECGRELEVDVDIAWLVLRALCLVCAEVELDVHVLASRYGWSLETIESLPDPRRRRLAALARTAS